METLEITIKKPYAKQVIDDLVAMDAIEMVKKPTVKMANYIQNKFGEVPWNLSQTEGEAND